MIEWDKLKYIPSYQNFSINLMKIPANQILLSQDNLADINSVLRDLFVREVHRGYWTPSGGLKKDVYSKRECFWIKKSKQALQLIYRKIIPNEGLRDYNIIFTTNNVAEENYISGGKCWNIFVKVLKKFNVYDRLLSQVLQHEEAIKIKAEIEQPLIELKVEPKKIYSDSYHIDLNSSFMSAIAMKWDFLYEPIKYMYDLRKKNKQYKDVLTHVYGFMQSYFIKGYLHLGDRGEYGLAQMSKEALRWNNAKIRDLIKQLESQGYTVLSTNTDGIWYQANGKKPFHNSEEGTGLGQWKTDKCHCTIRYKSKGAYEYIDNLGNYKPVLRGTTKFDSIVPRENWVWGDIFREDALPTVYTLIEMPGRALKFEVGYEEI